MQPLTTDAVVTHAMIDNFYVKKVQWHYQGSSKSFGMQIFNKWNSMDPILMVVSEFTKLLEVGQQGPDKQLKI